MAIFNGYVKLPEGTDQHPKILVECSESIHLIMLRWFSITIPMEKMPFCCIQKNTPKKHTVGYT
jgi:hypothetical protein